jgi:hypothetical protein
MEAIDKYRIGEVMPADRTIGNRQQGRKKKYEGKRIRE